MSLSGMSDVNHSDKARDAIRRILTLSPLSSFDVSVKLGKNRTYLDDFLRGRKNSLSSEFSHQLALLLDVHVDYITGYLSPPDKVNDWLAYHDIRRKIQYLEEAVKIAKAEADSIKARYAEAKQSKSSIAPELFHEVSASAFRHSQLQSELRQNLLMLEEQHNSRKAPAWNFPDDFVAGRLRSSPERIEVLAVPDAAMTGAQGAGMKVGDLVIVDKGRHDYRNGGLFALQEGASRYLRQAELVSSGPPATIRFVALNPEFSTFEVTIGGEVEVVGRAVAFIRLL